MQFLQLVISGIAQGCIYGLIALGFVLIYKATETVNFAQRGLVMLGAAKPETPTYRPNDPLAKIKRTIKSTEAA